MHPTFTARLSLSEVPSLFRRRPQRPGRRGGGAGSDGLAGMG